MPTFYRDLVPHLMTYKGGTAAACGTVGTALTVPADANCAVMHAEGGALYWGVGTAAVASTSAPGYTAQDNTGYVFACDNFTGLYVIGGGTAVVAHVEFYEG